MSEYTTRVPIECVQEIERLRSDISVVQGEKLFQMDRAERAEKQVERLRKEIEFYRDGMSRVAKELGMQTPLELVMMAETNEETYIDCLIKWIRKYVLAQKEEK